MSLNCHQCQAHIDSVHVGTISAQRSLQGSLILSLSDSSRWHDLRRGLTAESSDVQKLCKLRRVIRDSLGGNCFCTLQCTCHITWTSLVGSTSSIDSNGCYKSVLHLACIDWTHSTPLYGFSVRELSAQSSSTVMSITSQFPRCSTECQKQKAGPRGCSRQRLQIDTIFHL